MQEQQQRSTDPSLEGTARSNMVPYERFAEVNRQLKELRSEMANMKLGIQETESNNENSMSVEDICKRLIENPEAFLKEIVGQVMQNELYLLREEMELKSALKHARHQYPEFKTFENYILQELMGVVDEEPEIVKLSWDEILSKGLERVQARLKSAVQNLPEAIEVSGNAEEIKKAHIEGNTPRKHQPLMPNFSRSEIAKMSLSDFIKNEEAINEALKNNRIR